MAGWAAKVSVGEGTAGKSMVNDRAGILQVDVRNTRYVGKQLAVAENRRDGEGREPAELAFAYILDHQAEAAMEKT
jgi:hypothetical protein